ncbi:hypothetical protein EDB19DRAFT_1905624 [Suillus lakei]|nr:hypothetical protein EDB19DRAFT_1905624 [Suillus lakei]
MGSVFTKLIPRNTDLLKIEWYVACGIWNPATPFVTGKMLLAHALATSCQANGKGEGWQGEEGAENIKGLAKFTKGYGGADLWPETIGVTFRDFMISIKKLVPSSARSSSSSTSPLPTQLVPLLSDTLEKVKDSVDRVLPVSKKCTALEEAMWEDDSEANALDRELFIQCLSTMLHGSAGMGQGYLGAAALHHLEGYHVQTLDLGTLMGDSTWTVEATVVQLFIKAKQHQPSVIYLPSLDGWSAAEENDQRVITLLKYQLGPILTELKCKFKRFTKKAREEYDFNPIPVANEVEIAATTTTIAIQGENHVIDICEQVTQEQPNSIINGIHPDPQPIEHPAPLPPSVCISPTPYIKKILEPGSTTCNYPSYPSYNAFRHASALCDLGSSTSTQHHQLPPFATKHLQHPTPPPQSPRYSYSFPSSLP